MTVNLAALMSQAINAKDVETSSDQDSLRTGFTVLPSGLYEGLLKHAYVDQTQSGATFVNLTMNLRAKGTQDEPTEVEYRSFITNRQGDVFYVNKTTGKKNFLPGYQLIDELCYLTAGKPFCGFAQDEFVTKTINKFNNETKAQEPIDVSYIKPLTNIRVNLALIQKKDYKYSVDGPTTDTREFNEVIKFYSHDWRTKSEVEHNAVGEHAIIWENNNKGKMRDLTNRTNTAAMVSNAINTPEQTSIKISSILLKNKNNKNDVANDPIPF